MEYDSGKSLEDQEKVYSLLCLGALIGAHALPRNATINDAKRYFAFYLDNDCDKCPAKGACPVCVLEE